MKCEGIAEGGGLTQDGESERRTEKDDRRKEVGLASVYRLSGNTYGDREEEQEEEAGGGGGRSEGQRDKKEKDSEAEARKRERGCRNKRNE